MFYVLNVLKFFFYFNEFYITGKTTPADSSSVEIRSRHCAGVLYGSRRQLSITLKPSLEVALTTLSTV